ncbi:hypothetical protein CEXT_503341 [Caerostris extrusa]|uniref:Uncharacterized protein n=1 Tax=Caerostris extrusa TaxID=172846 RepID=A0AAV4XD27_CAEEX|nr:hypothetical protein CEXT_503341 [Caerostris extrusa]
MVFKSSSIYSRRLAASTITTFIDNRDSGIILKSSMAHGAGQFLLKIFQESLLLVVSIRDFNYEHLRLSTLETVSTSSSICSRRLASTTTTWIDKYK